jgi:ketosteroid isomerase-like protein
MSSPAPRYTDVLHIQQQFWAALQAKDAALFEQVLAPEFLSRSPGQPDQDQAAFIANLTGFPARVLAVGCEDLAVHFFGDVAVVTGLQTARVELPDGRVVANNIAITNVLRLTDAGWRMVLAHPVEL